MENLAKAMVKAQNGLHNLGKNKEGYGYSYLTLDKLIDETRGVLAECGLCVIQRMGIANDLPTVKTMVLHESGESIEGEYPISPVTMKQCNNAQELGAAITYARRYGLAAILNVAQADDDGACIGATNQLEDAARDLFDAKKANLTPEQANWCMDNIKKNPSLVIEKLKGM